MRPMKAEREGSPTLPEASGILWIVEGSCARSRDLPE